MLPCAIVSAICCKRCAQLFSLGSLHVIDASFGSVTSKTTGILLFSLSIFLISLHLRTAFVLSFPFEMADVRLIDISCFFIWNSDVSTRFLASSEF